MQIQINYGNAVEHSDALANHVRTTIDHAMRHVRDRFTRIEVHLHDDNVQKGGPADKRCVLEARPRGADPLAVEDKGDDMYRTVTTAAKKLERAAQRFVDRRNNH